MKQAKDAAIRTMLITYGLVILLSTSLIAFSLYSISNLHQVSSNIYLHPFLVSRAARDFEVNTLIIRDSMLEIVNGSNQLDTNIKDVDLAETLALEDLKVIKINFLGDLSKVSQIESLFTQWHQQRTHVLTLISKGQRADAKKQVTEVSLVLYQHIIERIDYVEDFARHKAEYYVDQSDHLLSTESKVLSGMFLLAILMIVFAGYSTRKYVRQFDQLSQADEKIHRLNSLLIAIRHINEHLLISQNEEGLFEFVCRTLSELNPIVTAWICLKMPDSILKPVGWVGITEEELLSKPCSFDEWELGKGLLGTAVRERRAIVMNRIGSDQNYSPWKELSIRGDIECCVGIPLLYEGDVIGGMMVCSNVPSYLDDEIVRFLTEVAGDIVIGIRSIRQTQKLNATLNSLATSLEGTISTIASIVEFRDPYTAGHERRVAHLACAIGKELGLPERQIEGLRVSGYLHDLGKISVPAEILSKPTKLTEVERQLVKQHPQTGFDILKNLEFPWPTALTILQHHERLDGSGYPNGLKGDEIILEARILMVADVVEAMSSHRPYRPGLGIQAALDEIVRMEGTHFDPEIVDACVTIFREKQYVIPN